MRLRRFAATTAAVAVAAGIAASSAGAAPAPGYERYAGCPDQADVQTCIRLEIFGGNLKLGTKNTPITAPITISGGIKNFQTLVFNSQGGMTTPRQKVPGGIVGITGLDWLLNLFGSDALSLYARAQLVGNPTNPLFDPSQIKLKIKLEGSILSNSCYIGSDSNPIVLNLTRGTTSPPPPNTPISGVEPLIEEDPSLAGNLLIRDGLEVDNSFSVPTANGCGLLIPNFSIINPLVNAQAGLPSAAGKNEAKFQFRGQFIDAEQVYPG